MRWTVQNEEIWMNVLFIICNLIKIIIIQNRKKKKTLVVVSICCAYWTKAQWKSKVLELWNYLLIGHSVNFLARCQSHSHSQSHNRSHSHSHSYSYTAVAKSGPICLPICPFIVKQLLSLRNDALLSTVFWSSFSRSTNEMAKCLGNSISQLPKALTR